MNIRYVGKSLKVTEGIKKHLEVKVEKFERYAPRLVEAHAILKKEKYLFEAEITVLAKNLRAFGKATSKENIFGAIDQACLRVEKQLKKYREKVKDHHKKPALAGKAKRTEKVPAAMDLEDFESENPAPKVIATPAFAPKPMTIEEASLQLDISDQAFLTFYNAEKKKVSVLYKREDGNHGLIEPEF